MMEKNIEVRTADGVAKGFLYQPDEHGTWPGVIFLTDIGGIRPAELQKAQEIASRGYVVLVPNIFYRTGEPPVIAYPVNARDEKAMQRIGELRASLPPDAMERDGSAYVDFLAAQPTVGRGSLGIVGYCLTGPMALRIAAKRPEKIAAAASFHGGGLFTDAPTSPHLVLPRVKAELYFGHAIEDRSMPKETLEKLEQALAAWGGKYESETYDGAYHSWTTLDSPVYNKTQAERAFGKLTALFGATLS
ncbi:MAG: dienelactone hydrolase family protein [Candidatus Acidiferrales bacterium]